MTDRRRTDRMIAERQETEGMESGMEKKICPKCGGEMERVCSRCGYDRSLDFEQYPSVTKLTEENSKSSRQMLQSVRSYQELSRDDRTSFEERLLESIRGYQEQKKTEPSAEKASSSEHTASLQPFVIGERSFENADQIGMYMKELLARSPKELERFCRQLIGADGTLDASLEHWLEKTGRRDSR